MNFENYFNLYLEKIRKKPPFSILLEGGSSLTRFEVFKSIAKKLNCSHSKEEKCSFCLNLEKKEGIDTFIFSGQEVKIEDIRELKLILAHKPKLNYRIICFEEAQDLNISCINSLLKSIEEPPPKNIFFFLLPQRQNILPTIVSRSFILNISFFSEKIELPQKLKEVANFFNNGINSLTLKKTNIEKKEVRDFITFLQKEIINSSLKKDSIFREINPEKFYKINMILNLAQNYLSYNCNPSLVLEWIMFKTFLVYKNSL